MTTMTTPFLRSLKPVDLRTRPAVVAQRFMTVKGFGGVRPLGMVHQDDDNCWYYYYDLPDGLLELEVCRTPDTDGFTRNVVGFVTDPEQLSVYLGR